MNNSVSTSRLALVVFCSAFSQIMTALPASAFKSKQAQWHPGHYIFIDKGNVDANLCATSTKFRGLQKRYEWNALEPVEGKYNFQSIKDDLSALKKSKLRLVVQLQCKAFGKDRSACPSDLKGSLKKDGTSYSGTYRTSTGSLNPVFWDSAVTNRLINLYNALGRELATFKDADALEAVCLSETALSSTDEMVEQSGCTAFSSVSYVDQLARGFSALNNALPHTVVIQYTNFIRGHKDIDVLKGKFVSDALAEGVGLGGPDLCPPSYGHAGLQAPEGIYSVYPGLAHKIPLGTAVQFKDAVGDPRVTFEFGRDNLKLNYIFWMNRADGYLVKVAAVLNDPKIVPADDPAGGLDSTYPAAIKPLD